MAGLRSFLLEQTAAGGDKAVLQYVTNLLNGNVGFLFNERVINIPAQITVPLLETLVTEMRKAKDRNLPYDFSHYIMISKLYKTKTDSNQDHQVELLFYLNFLLQLSILPDIGLLIYRVGTVKLRPIVDL